MRISDWSSDVCPSDLDAREMEQAGALEQSIEVIILGPGRREARPCAVVDDFRRAQPGADAEEVKPHPPRMERDGGAVDACTAHRRHRTETQCVRRNRTDPRAVQPEEHGVGTTGGK